MIDQSLLFFTDIDDFVLFILRKEIELDWKFATGVVYNTFLKIQQYPEACNYSIVRILSRLLAVTKKVMLFIVNDAPLFDEAETLKHDAAVQYTLSKNDTTLKLPEKYNGLGYQNLISMVFDLMRFRDDWMREGKAKQATRDSDRAIEPCA